MRKLLIVLVLTAAVASGCGMAGLVNNLSNLFSQIGGCDVYDANNDGIVTVQEVREVFEMFGFPADAFSDAELLDAVSQLGCRTS